MVDDGRPEPVRCKPAVVAIRTSGAESLPAKARELAVQNSFADAEFACQVAAAAGVSGERIAKEGLFGLCECEGLAFIGRTGGVVLAPFGQMVRVDTVAVGE